MSNLQDLIEKELDIEELYKKYKKFLKGAKEGEVVTRFPPEPSGYLHIGHIKAAMLNYHFAKMYKGKMIFRLDDTNPSKEKLEYQESIIEDLKTLNIYPDKHTSTSDHFDLIMDKAVEFIKEGNAYCDDTDEELMKAERMERKESKHRQQSIEETLRIFDLMAKGDEKYKKFCLRARINMKSNNGCMRDPVIYRRNDTPHHATGTKYKIYPTYDLVCPIVDSLEGVTHALRSNEYTDRNELYNFFLKKMNLRPVIIQDFSRLNFVKTTLSKRKLGKIVESGVVDGWRDPRMPTIGGVLRRGMTIPSLVEFMLEQGPSKNANLMQWDKFWAINYKRIDKIVPRYTALDQKHLIKADIVQTESSSFGSFSCPLHQKQPSLGDKLIFKTNQVFLERQDLKVLQAGSKILLMKWGVFEIVSIDLSSNLLQIKYLPEDKDFKNPPKLTWICSDPILTLPVKTIEYDYLLTVDKVEENMDFDQIVNRNSKFEHEFLAESCVKDLAKGDIIQFERKGFYILDKKEISGEGQISMTFHLIPDGKEKPLTQNTN